MFGISPKSNKFVDHNWIESVEIRNTCWTHTMFIILVNKFLDQFCIELQKRFLRYKCCTRIIVWFNFEGISELMLKTVLL